MGIGMMQNPQQSRLDNKATPAPLASTSANSMLRDMVRQAQAKQGKAAPKLIVNTPQRNKNDLGATLLGGSL